jgi:phospholipid N-methyltransferase
MSNSVLMSGSIVHDYAEFSQQSVNDIVNKIVKFQELSIEDFKNSDSQFDFYANSKNYIYDLLGGHPDMDGPIQKINKFLPGVLDYIKEHPGKKFLELGGGIGDICHTISSWGKEVTYMDIESHITEFARWRFKKYNVDVNMKIIPQDSFELTETYDFIYQDAVLEHLTPVQQVSYTSKLAKNLNLNGVFVMVVDLSGESENMPMHYNVDIVKVHKAIIDEGLTCYYGLNTFASVWMRTI